MVSALLVRFRPVGPWRLGPSDGTRSRTDRVFHSDSLYSAVTIAMRDLGWLEEWLSVTAESAAPAVRLTSCFPYTAGALLISPPRSVWPPIHAERLRWKAAKFVPVKLAGALLRGDEVREDAWVLDPLSECVLPVLRGAPAPSPFRLARRVTVAVDRVNGTSETADASACLEFAQGAGMWCAATFDTDATRQTWMPRVRSAFWYLADTGIGGGRSRGWGRSARPKFEDVDLDALLAEGAAPVEGERGWWLLSVFSPAESDAIDWNSGSYSVLARTGRFDAEGTIKPAANVLAEGSVVVTESAPTGSVANLAGGGGDHPVYRSGIAVAVAVPWRQRDAFALLHEKPATGKGEEETVQNEPDGSVPVAPEPPAPEPQPDGAGAGSEEQNVQNEPKPAAPAPVQNEPDAFPPAPGQEPDGAVPVAPESTPEAQPQNVQNEPEPVSPEPVQNEPEPAPETPGGSSDAFPETPGQEPDGAAPVAPDNPKKDANE